VPEPGNHDGLYVLVDGDEHDLEGTMLDVDEGDTFKARFIMGEKRVAHPYSYNQVRVKENLVYQRLAGLFYTTSFGLSLTGLYRGIRDNLLHKLKKEELLAF